MRTFEEPLHGRSVCTVVRSSFLKEWQCLSGMRRLARISYQCKFSIPVYALLQSCQEPCVVAHMELGDFICSEQTELSIA